ncbi:hypothetical protein H4R99_001237 [Coemansia sp. RSA 1722]|nr:hypothetical protein LPJ57_000571 [Coemansia sp. RSA 486]KAJ2237012.1 hypothetical protein IWW45_001296 [Coemansia sp. RSA 485]KAJ2603545.1 hypothetical protein GGF39_000038 [Coemansia sp. RSA 1721]KAJ2605320.1 hypothetical protein H4R99_001237 [Coemansia sp. RSA 1722]KAJ2638695.1 hypothetical protein GGF40_001471 [Coemansia sp. RSA 1286]
MSRLIRPARKCLSTQILRFKRCSSSNHGKLREALAENPPLVSQTVNIGIAATNDFKRLIKKKVSWKQGYSANGSYESMLRSALKAKDAYRLHKVFERMLVEDIRQGKHTDVSAKVFHSAAHLILAKLLESRERSMVAAGEILGEIGWRTRIRPDLLITVLAMAAHEATGNEREYMRSRMCLKWGNDSAALVRSVLQMRGISLRVIGDLFDAVEDNLSIDRLEATRFYLACVPHGAAPEKVASKLRLFHQEVVDDLVKGSLEKRKIGLTALALVHLHISAGDMDRANECLKHFVKLNVESRWPMGAISAAVQHKYSTPKDMLPMLAAVASDDFSEFTQCIEQLPVFRTRTVRLTMLKDELQIRRQMPDEHLPMTRFFVPRLIIRADNPDIYRMVEQHYATDELLRPVSTSWLVKEAGGLAFRLQSMAPLLLLVTKLANNSQRVTCTPERLLSSMTRVLDSSEMLLHLEKSDVKTRSAYTDIAASCTELRKTLLHMYLRLGIEPSVEQLAILHNQMYSAMTSGIYTVDNQQQQLSSLTSLILAQASPGKLARLRLNKPTTPLRLFYEHLVRRLALNHSRAVLKLYQYVTSHPSITDHEFIMRYTTIMVDEYIKNGHFYNKGFFRLEKTLVRSLSSKNLPKHYFNTLWPRLWALHMFLRRRRYVARYKIYPWQLHCQQNNTVFCYEPTRIPLAEKMREQNIDTHVEPLDPKDIESAAKIMSESIPDSLPTTERHGLDKMLHSNTQMISL